MHPNVCTVLVSTLSVNADLFNQYMDDDFEFNADTYYNMWSSTRIPMISCHGEVMVGVFGVIAARLLNIETMQVEQLS